MSAEPVVIGSIRHEFVASEAQQGPGCRCGWVAAGSVSPDLALRRWQLHVNSVLADARRREATELQRQVHARAYELQAQRDESMLRRAEVVMQRARLARQLTKLRHIVAGQHVVQADQTRYLDSARRMASLDVSSLWLRYVAVGGNSSFQEIKRALSGMGVLSVGDFNLLGLAINEAFADVGLGHPVDYVGTRGDGVAAEV